MLGYLVRRNELKMCIKPSLALLSVSTSVELSTFTLGLAIEQTLGVKATESDQKTIFIMGDKFQNGDNKSLV
jgi:hypothetical protein